MTKVQEIFLHLIIASKITKCSVFSSKNKLASLGFLRLYNILIITELIMGLLGTREHKTQGPTRATKNDKRKLMYKN